MLNLKDTPVGIDWHIQKAQQKLHTYLTAKWAIADKDYECYGRAYRNKEKSGYIAEVYDANGEYKEVYWDDKLKAISFFGVGENIAYSTQSTANVHLVFFVNLKKLKPSITHRADEEIRQDVFNAFGKSSYGLVFQSFDLWLDNVLREYPGSRRDERLKYVDMHPVHCFRLNYKISFDPNKNC